MLGAFEAWDEAGQPVQIPGTRLRTLLARLAQIPTDVADAPFGSGLATVGAAQKDCASASHTIKEVGVAMVGPQDEVMLVTDDRPDTAKSVERLMGTKAEARFEFIQERAEFAREDMLDV